MKRYYYVDSENVGDNWIKLLQAVNSEDVFIVFYTDKSPNMKYENLILVREAKNIIQFEKCYKGPNALDFQLTTQIGYDICNNTAEIEYVVVSNDAGFDAVVKYWKDREVLIRRVCEENIIMENSKQSSMKNLYTVEEIFDLNTFEKINSCNSTNIGVPEHAQEMLFLIGKDNKGPLCNALTQLYGVKKGTQYYNILKPASVYDQLFANRTKIKVTKRQQDYCSLVIKEKKPSETIPDNLAQVIMVSWKNNKNLSMLHTALKKAYGEKKGDSYYSLFKKHIKIIDKIK